MKNRFRINILLFLFLAIGIVPIMKVDAYVPVTYTCCHNYTFSNGIQLDNFENVISSNGPLDGIQLDNFENLSNWTVGGTIGYSQEADTVNVKEGLQGLKLIAKYGNITNFNRTYSDKVVSNNFSNTNNFGVWVYVYNKSTLNQITLYFTSTGNAWSKYFTKGIGSTNLVSGWNKLIIDKNSFTTPNGESWNNLMTRMRIAVVPITGQDTNATFDDFRYNISTGNWTVSGSGFLLDDDINFKEGIKGLKLVATNGNTVATDKVINNNFSTTNNFAIWAYIDNASNIGPNAIAIYFTSSDSTSTFGDKYFWDSIWSYKTGWNKFVFNKQNFRNVGGESWNNIMKKVRLRIYPAGMIDLNITFDDLRYNMTGQRAKLMIEFDDGDLSAFTKAYPILRANNQTGVSWVVTSWIGDDPIHYMNLDNLKTLQGADWDIGSHSAHHVDLTAMTDSQLTSELNDSYDWLTNNNFQKSAGFIAYPRGQFNDAVIDKVKKRYIFGRSVMPESAQQHFTPTDDAIQYIQRVIYVLNTTSVQSVKDQINASINAKLLGILTFHDIVDSNPSTYQYLTTDLQTISDYIKSRSADIDVITYSDYVIPNINDFTPVINKTTRIYSNGSSVLITKNKYDEYMPNMTLKPSSDSIDINITAYNESGGSIKFNESSQNNSLQVSYDIGDRIPNQKYLVQIYWANGTKYQDFEVLSDNAGHIKYDSTGFGDPRYQQIILESGMTFYNIVHQKYIYQKNNMVINFSLEGYIEMNSNVTITSPNGNVTTYNITMQNSPENESIIYTGINESGIYTITYSIPSFTRVTTFEYKQKPILTFVSASDLHYGYADDPISSGFTINRFISDINNQVFFPSPDFVALVGDTADNILYNNIAASKTLYDTFNVPYYITNGNMEVSYNDTSYEPIGYRGQTFYDSYGRKYNYTVTKGGYTFIFGGVEGDYPPLTNYVGKSFGSTYYSLWLDKVLVENAYKPTIAFSHYSAQKPRDAGGAQGEETYASTTRSKFEKYNNMPAEFSGDGHLVSKNVRNNITYIIDGAIINQPYVFDYVEIYSDKIQVHTIPYRLDTDNFVQYVGSYWEGNTDSSHTAANYTIGNPDENEFTITLVNITPTKLANLWNFTANNIPANKITLGNNNIISNNVLINLSAYEVRDILNMTIATSSEIMMNVTTFNATLVKFNESSSDSLAQVSYNIGDRIPNQIYSVQIYWANGTKYKDFNILADSAGYIKYNSEGFGDPRYQEIKLRMSSFNIIYNVI